jgi:CBS domain containing-hemolysin-like protein
MNERIIIRGAREHNLRTIDLDGYRFTVVQATANRIDLVRITRLPSKA